MRPLVHPPIRDVTVSGILHALADPTRLMIFADMMAAKTATSCSPYLSLAGVIPKSTLSHHFRVLREAGLIHSQRQGKTVLSTARWEELRPRFGDLLRALLDLCQTEDGGCSTERACRATASPSD
jgi:DNA-binding transcriptional ArsR family regulator